MGCSSSKEKSASATDEKPEKPKPAPVVEKPKPAPVVKPVEVEKPRELPPPTPQEDPRPAATDAELRALDIKDKIDGKHGIACFPDGLVYRLEKDGSIFYYNDTTNYEAHVTYSFGPGSQVTPGPRTIPAGTDSNGWSKYFCVVYPLETVVFASGRFNGKKVKISLEPLSEEYLDKETKDAIADVDEQLRRVKSFGLTDLEEVLAKCVETNTPFVDLDFPPVQSSLSRPEIDTRKFSPMAFRRPVDYLPEDLKDKSDDIVGPITPAAVERGHLGDCWVTCAASIMANSEALIRQIFAYGNHNEKKVGAFRVLIQKNGWYQKVILDNFLPTRGGVPAFACSRDDPRELWVSLFQKAYAKVNGSFASITGGDALHVLQDFTGAPIYRFDAEWEKAVKDENKAAELAALFVENASNIIVLSTARGKKSAETLQKVGLRGGFTYLVDRVVPVEGTVLFHVSNPWGLNTTWTGAWSDGSEEWKKNVDAKLLCKPSWNKAGEFWMCWEDVKTYFNGGGIIYNNENVFNYSIRGMFQNLIPTAVLEVKATEETEVTLTLTQRDKRGVPLDEPDAIQGAILLSVSEEESENRQVIKQNTSVKPAHPTTADEFEFVADRAVSMKFTFAPGKPYFVIPRLHSGAVEPEHQREYVVSIGSTSSLQGKINVEVKQIPSSSRVFKNLIRFSSSDIFNVEAEQQVSERFDPKIRVSSVLVAA